VVWNLVLVGAGYLLGERWHQVEQPLELFQTAVLVVIAVAVAWFVWRRIVRPRLRAS
jgi:membrane protein DedA with SNARE-associated domain